MLDKKRVNTKGQYKLEIKNSQREVMIARIHQGSMQLNTSNENLYNKPRREYLISMVDGRLLKPYTPMSLQRKEVSRETCQNSRVFEAVSRKQSLRNASPKTICERLTEKLNDISNTDESHLDLPELILQRQNAYFEKKRRLKQQYDEGFVKKVNENVTKLVKQCQDFYTTRMRFDDKFTQLVHTLHRDRPLTSSLRSRSITTTHKNQRDIRKCTEKARQDFFLRNKEQREWHEQLFSQFSLLDQTCQYISEQLLYILEEGLFIQIDDIIGIVQKIEHSQDLRVTVKCCKIINEIFKYFGIEITQLDQNKKFKNFNSYIIE